MPDTTCCFSCRIFVGLVAQALNKNKKTEKMTEGRLFRKNIALFQTECFKRAQFLAALLLRALQVRARLRELLRARRPRLLRGRLPRPVLPAVRPLRRGRGGQVRLGPGQDVAPGMLQVRGLRQGLRRRRLPRGPGGQPVLPSVLLREVLSKVRRLPGAIKILQSITKLFFY